MGKDYDKSKEETLDLEKYQTENLDNKKELVLYDGGCNLCIYWKQLLQTKDKQEVLAFTPIQYFVSTNLYILQ